MPVSSGTAEDATAQEKGWQLKDNLAGEGAMVGGYIAMGGRRRATRAILAALCAVGALAAAGAAPAAATPTLAISSPANGSFTNNTTPTVKGSSTDTSDQVTVNIFKAGATEAVQSPTATPSEGNWSVALSSLSDGEYTAVAEQTELTETGKSPAVKFTVKTTPPKVTLKSIASPSSNPSPTLEGEVGTAAGDEPAVTVTIYRGESVGGSVAAKGSATVSGSEWTYAPPQLADGTYTAQAVQLDQAENTGKSTPQTFTIKAHAPVVTLEPVLPTPSNNPTPTLEGEAGTAPGDEPAVTVKIYAGPSVGATALVSGAAKVSGSHWSYESLQLEDGTYTAQASQRDTLGKTGKSEPQTFTIDTVPPQVTLNPVPSPSNNATPTLKGEAGTESDDQQAVTVTIYKSPTAGGPVANSGKATLSAGSWTYTPKGGLPEGTYTAQATQRDAAGNVGSSLGRTFTVKIAKPVVTLNPPKSPSNNSTPSFGGNADTGPGNIQSVTLRVYAGGEPSGTAVRTLTALVSGGGEWSAGPVAKLSDGTYTAQAEQEDEAGNAGVSAPATFTISTAPPNVTINPIGPQINDPTPTLEGSRGTAQKDAASVTVTVYEGGSAGGNVAATSTFGVSGAAWSYTTPHLNDGTYTARAEQKDSAGNTGKSAAVTFTVDTVLPGVTLNTVPTPSNNSTPELSGGAGSDEGDSATVSIKIYEGSSTGGKVATTTAATRSGGSWSSTSSHLEDGTYTAQATQRDAAGNVGTSEPRTFTINTASPEVTLASPAPLSNNTTPSFSGTASDTTPVTVAVYAGSKAAGTAVWKATVAVGGESWSAGPVSPALGDGQYTAIATQPSSLGNPPGKSQPATFTINTKAPTVTLAQPPSPSKNLSPTFTGTTTDTPLVAVRVYEGERPEGKIAAETTAKPVGEAWSSGPVKPMLATGTHTYTAVAVQKSAIPGNPEGTSIPMIFTVDTNPPTVSLNPQTKPRSNNPSPVFTGTATDTSAVTVNIYKGKVVKGSPVTTASATPTAGVWTSGATLAPLAEGEYTAQAIQPSSIENEPGKSATITLFIDTKAPAVTMTPLKAQINTPGPELKGQVGIEKGDIAKIPVKIYKGAAVGGEIAIEGEGTITVSSKVSTWAFKSSNLPDGTYTAQATQEDEAGNIGVTPPSTFTIDTIAPTVTLNPPAARSNNRAPTFTGTGSELTPVTITIYNESSTEVSKTTATGTAGAWTSAPASPELPNVKGKHGYTAAATQIDEAGNVTTTPRVKFVVDTEAPALTLVRPPARTNNRTPSFTGTASDTTPVTVKIFESGTEVTQTTAPGTGGAWKTAPVPFSLPDGHYTVVALQESAFGNHSSETEAAALAVDTVAPVVAISSPEFGHGASSTSQVVSGSAGTNEGDLPGITVQLYAGEAVGPAIQTVVVNAVGKNWSATFAGLPAGTYTARAEQSDEAGNVGTSGLDTFHLTSTAAAVGRPAASFSWYPPAPHAGERVSLVSSSTDPTSTLSAFAWDLTGSGSFQLAGPVVSTSFATPGNHLVRLRVTDATGMSNLATQTIPVGSPQAAVLRPFPLVRVLTTRTGSGLKLRLLSVLAGPGDRITITCRGHGCPVHRQTKVQAAGKAGLASVSFRRFERVLPVGTTIEIRVFKLGEIGKFTSLSIRRGEVLRRIDACLTPNGIKQMPCPAG
jgi:large repetitive protein